MSGRIRSNSGALHVQQISSSVGVNGCDGIYVITGCLEPKAALSCFSNSSVIIMGSMFIVAGGLSRTQMVHRVTNLAYKVSGGSFQKGMILYCLVTLAIAQVAPSAILIFLYLLSTGFGFLP